MDDTAHRSLSFLKNVEAPENLPNFNELSSISAIDKMKNDLLNKYIILWLHSLTLLIFQNKNILGVIIQQPTDLIIVAWVGTPKTALPAYTGMTLNLIFLILHDILIQVSQKSLQ